MKESNQLRYSHFIGIDVSKNELDFAIMAGSEFLFHSEIKNCPNSIIDFINELKKIPKFHIAKAVFCMESTGFYNNHLLNCLKRIKANVVRENPIQIISSLGKIRGKNDKVDSKRIANYAYKNRHELTLFNYRRPIIEQLAFLSALRKRLIATIKTLRTPIKEQKSFISKKIQTQITNLSVNAITALQADLVAVQQTMLKVIEEDIVLKRFNEIITSIPHVGPITSAQIIITTNEFKNFNDPKKFACHAGVAPFPHESGKHKGKAKISHFANKEIKTLLHLCAIGAVRGCRELREYFTRKTVEEKKPKMVVINAVRFKLILRIFACVNQNRLYQADYTNDGKYGV